jgi:hypothetical protein
MEELKRQLKREFIGDLRPIFESQGLHFPNIPGMMEEHRSGSVASVAVAPMNRE